MHRRIRIFNHWLTKNANGVSFFELVRHLIGPRLENRARPWIKSIEKAGGYLKVNFFGFGLPLYWPEEMALQSLYMVISEVFDPSDWHHYEIETTKVERGDVVVDCGAAEGLFSFVNREKCQKIYIIEPLPRFVQSLKLTFSKQSNIEILPYALSSSRGYTEMTSDGISSRIVSTGKPKAIPLTTLDILFYERKIPVSYIKADLEGFDYEMIKGAENLVAANLPKIAITTYHNREHAPLIADHLKKIHPRYKTAIKGIYALDGSPVMLHAWVDEKDR